MSDHNINQVLNQMRILAQKSAVSEKPDTGGADFSAILKNSIEKVNSYQQDAADLKTAYELGDSNVDIPEVMVAIQKASLSFEAVTEVRNQLLNAYQEVMNMQV